MNEDRPLLSNEPYGDDSSSRGPWDRECVVGQGVVMLCNFAFNLSFYSLLSNLVLFLRSENIGWDSTTALSAVYLTMATGFLFSIMAGWCSNRYISKFIGTCFGLSLCLAVYVPLVIFAGKSIDIHGKNVAALVVSLIGFAFGSALTQVCLPLLGADLLYGRDDRNARPSKDSFFGHFLISTNLGILVALAVVSYLQQNVSFFIGYMVSVCTLAVSVVTLLCSYSIFRRVERQLSVGNFDAACLILKVVCESLRNKLRCRRLSGDGAIFGDQAQHTASAPSFLDNAKITFNGSYPDNLVDEVKTFLKITMVFLLVIPYKILHAQVYSTFIVQALHMKLTVPKSVNFTIPVTWLCLLNQVFTISLVVIVRKVTNQRNRQSSIRCHFMLGMLLAAIGMALAGLVDLWRWDVGSFSVVEQTIGNAKFFAANLNVFWQMPQYLLLSASEVFLAIPALEYFYVRAPIGFRSLTMGFLYAASGFGFLLSLVIYLGCTSLASRIPVLHSDVGPVLFPFFFFLSLVQVLASLVYWRMDYKHPQFLDEHAEALQESCLSRDSLMYSSYLT